MKWKTYTFLVLLAISAVFAVIGREGVYNFAVDHSLDKFNNFLNKPPTQILVFGDMMFDRKIRQIGENKGYDYLFSCIKPTLLNADLVMANLEGPITDHKSKSLNSKVGASDNYQFTFDPKVATTLVLNNIGVVNLGNNHILNFGVEGLKQTTDNLNKVGIKFFGEPSFATNTDEISYSVARVDLGDNKLSFINYNEFWRASATNTIYLINKEIVNGREPIVYTHWGTEYATSSNAEQRELAHKFIDAGAIAALGSHPHVIEEHEMYMGKPIYYSLGNFIFDQYFSDDVMHGLGLRITFRNGQNKNVEDSKIDVEEIKLELLHDGRAKEAGDDSCMEATSTTEKIITLPI